MSHVFISYWTYVQRLCNMSRDDTICPILHPILWIAVYQILCLSVKVCIVNLLLSTLLMSINQYRLLSIYFKFVYLSVPEFIITDTNSHPVVKIVYHTDCLLLSFYPTVHIFGHWRIYLLISFFRSF